MDPLTSVYSPHTIALQVEDVGVAKARTNAFTLLVLAILAGAFISLGGAVFTVTVTGSTLGLGPTRLLGGLAFCLGLVLVILAGAELFTGNNLIAMAWASRRITTVELLRNWCIVDVGNAIGAIGTVVLIYLAKTHDLGGGAVGETALAIGIGKAELDPLTLMARGVLCNALVCLAVWLAMGGRTLTDKLLAVLFPISAFVALGFEHSIANWFFLPWALALDDGATNGLISSSLANLALVTIGNIIGGTLLVAAVYWAAYLRTPAQRDPI